MSTQANNNLEEPRAPSEATAQAAPGLGAAMDKRTDFTEGTGTRYLV